MIGFDTITGAVAISADNENNYVIVEPISLFMVGGLLAAEIENASGLPVDPDKPSPLFFKDGFIQEIANEIFEIEQSKIAEAKKPLSFFAEKGIFTSDNAVDITASSLDHLHRLIVAAVKAKEEMFSGTTH